ncbi:acyltransferase family protein [Caulobacter mirabilis]|uniref:Acetyltransferase n=1 Tax=Caulobacter mirabilis TaxID=69666 RepID=A0A2D2AZG6_9CAUL|nr:acyltransferase family protein [Caulobacter mirabilis]ATQ43398.1 acetyltransferase [Caulobacter mirabilis]
MTDATPVSDRRNDLDWIRVGAFFLLILYHVGMFYVPWDWHVKSPHPIEWLEPVMQLTNPWRLTLLFLVSGAATRFMADKLSAGALAGQRLWRLLPPLVFAMFVIVPPQSYYEVVEQLGYAGGYVDFWPAYVTASGNWCQGDDCLITPTWNHMWFVAYLIFYTLVLAVLLWVARKPLVVLGDWLGRTLSGWRLLLLPIVWLAFCRIVLMPRFEITHAFGGDWYNHAMSFAAFLLGFLVAKSETFRAATIRLRWPALALAVGAWAAWATYAWIYRDGAAPPEALRQTMRVVYATDQWCAILAVLGFGARHLTRGGPALTYLTLAVFPFYIVHQTVIVVAAYHLSKLGLNQALEGALVIALTFAACFATYEIVRRVAVLRPLFGLKLAADGAAIRAAWRRRRPASPA